jgi:hypothetical protein
MAYTACFVCLVSIVCGCRKNPLEEQGLAAVTKQTLSNLLFLDIYGLVTLFTFWSGGTPERLSSLWVMPFWTS